jgi:hypothetical protein
MTNVSLQIFLTSSRFSVWITACLVGCVCLMQEVTVRLGYDVYTALRWCEEPQKYCDICLLGSVSEQIRY